MIILLFEISFQVFPLSFDKNLIVAVVESKGLFDNLLPFL